jgi:hypothetical protein
LNYPPDGKCNDCTRGTCRYDKICFMCGLEGHGAFQSFPGGKLKGELKCSKHRNFLSQLGMIRLQHGIDEDGLRALFKLPGYNADKAPSAKKSSAAAAPAATVPAGTAETAKDNATATSGTATTAAAATAPTNAVDGKGKEAAVSGTKAEVQASTAAPAKLTGKQAAAAAAAATAPVVPTATPAAAAPAVVAPFAAAAAVVSAPAPVQKPAAVEGTSWQMNLDGAGLSAGFLGTGDARGVVCSSLRAPIVTVRTVK